MDGIARRALIVLIEGESHCPQVLQTSKRGEIRLPALSPPAPDCLALFSLFLFFRHQPEDITSFREGIDHEGLTTSLDQNAKQVLMTMQADLVTKHMTAEQYLAAPPDGAQPGEKPTPNSDSSSNPPLIVRE